MCNLVACGITTTVIGAILVFATAFVGYWVIPGIVENQVIDEVILHNDTEAIERFQEVPLTLNFTVNLFTVTNPEAVLNGGIPVVREAGPYIYSLQQRRVIENFEEDKLTYRMLDLFQFNAAASHPNTEDDIVTIINVPFIAIMSTVEEMGSALLSIVNLGLNGIFGQYNGPIANIRVGDLLFDGITLCGNPVLVSGVACSIIRSMSSEIRNMVVQPDNSIKFSVLGYRNNSLGRPYEVYRGIDDIEDLGRISLFDGLPHLNYWLNNTDGDLSVCNMINGTDSGIYNPFIDTSQSLYALNPDICRSVELRYDQDTEYEGLPAVRFTANEWMFPDEDCFCLNVTKGVTRDNGCLFPGVFELFTCLGAYLVISYPHFLYGDPVYINGIIGLNPNIENHRIFLEIEPITGTVMRAAKRAQFNIFLRSFSGITSTQFLRTVLMPIFWVQESVELSIEYVERLENQLFSTLNLLAILIPVLVAISGVIFVAGILLLIRTRFKRKPTIDNIPTARSMEADTS